MQWYSTKKTDCHFGCRVPWQKALVGKFQQALAVRMNKDAEKRIAAQLAKAMTMICVRNTMLEDLHVGPGPITRTGDYSDVVVLDADGNRIPWSEVSRIDDDEMRDLMRQIVNRLYTFHLNSDDPALRSEIDRWMTAARKWDEPELDPGLARSADASGKQMSVCLEFEEKPGFSDAVTPPQDRTVCPNPLPENPA